MMARSRQSSSPTSLAQSADGRRKARRGQLHAARRLIQRGYVWRLDEFDRVVLGGVFKEGSRDAREPAFHRDIIITGRRLCLAGRKHKVASTSHDGDRYRLFGGGQFTVELHADQRRAAAGQPESHPAILLRLGALGFGHEFDDRQWARWSLIHHPTAFMEFTPID